MELAAIHWALDSIASRPVGHYYIVTDSLSSVDAIHSIRPGKHSPFFLEKIRDILSALTRRRFSITFVWVPSHCSIVGNEKADSLAKVGATEGDTYPREIVFNEFYFLVRGNSLVNWQRKWDEDEDGRWLHSIIPKTRYSIVLTLLAAICVVAAKVTMTSSILFGRVRSILSPERI
ncbi:uncharacterized protein LOC129742155 [Uranotaenia lowii]|uniref:uncharacterized protein LOC129742155 n=1 Tax=Uranotaenia lowii TaxID=190385 RepID=UPI00247A57B3|nr:uncharacterized protein LOC129742155 [Uranotaenia lowii]